MTNQSAFMGVEVGNYRNYVKRNAIFGIPHETCILAFFAHILYTSYSHITRILEKSIPA